LARQWRSREALEWQATDAWGISLSRNGAVQKVVDKGVLTRRRRGVGFQLPRVDALAEAGFSESALEAGVRQPVGCDESVKPGSAATHRPEAFSEMSSVGLRRCCLDLQDGHVEAVLAVAFGPVAEERDNVIAGLQA
jgi:hypothetical protein